MNKNSNLQKALKQAFEEHTEPLNEAQWDRLSAAMGERKSKRKFLPWILGLTFLIGLSAGIGYWLGNNAGTRENLAGKTINTSANVDKSLSSADVNNSTQNNKAGNAEGEINVLHSDKMSDKTSGKADMEIEKHGDNRSGGVSPSNKLLSEVSMNSGGRRGGKSADKSYKDLMFASNDGTDKKGKRDLGSENEKDGQNILPSDNLGNAIIDENISLDKEPLLKNSNQRNYKKDEVHVLPKPADSAREKNHKVEDRFRRFAIGFNSGYSQAVYRDMEFTKPKNMHMDTKELYNESVKKTSSRFVNLFFDIRVMKNLNLSFNSGVQYREVSSKENIDYKLRYAPFRDLDGSITGYIGPYPDSTAIVFANNSTYTSRFVSIPLALNYTFSLKKKNEIQVTGGVVLNKIISGKGKIVSLNEQDVVNFNDRIVKKITLGYLGGLNYYRQIYKAWWIGAGMQVQRNKTQFNTTYGFIKSDINITNYTLNIKYKF